MKWLLGIVFLATPGIARAQNPVSWKLISPKTVSVARGALVQVQVRADIDKGWRVYSVTQKKGGPYAMSISVMPGAGAVIVGAIKSSQPASKYDAEFKMITETYSGSPVFAIPISTSAYRGSKEVVLRIRYQACSDKFCLPPHNVLIPVKLKIVSG